MFRRSAAKLCLALGMLAPVTVPLATPIAAYAENCTNFTVTVTIKIPFTNISVQTETTYSICTS
jgi:hypothetical protein